MYIPIATGGGGTGFERLDCFTGPYTVTLLAPFSLSRLETYLAQSFATLGWRYRLKIASETSAIRYVLDQQSGLPRHPAGVHLLLFRLQDWNNVAEVPENYQGLHPASRELIERNLRKIIQGLQDTMQACFGTVVLVVCPPSGKYKLNRAAAAYFADLELQLREALAGGSQYFVFNAEDLVSAGDDDAPSREPGDPNYTDRFYQQLSRKLARICYAAEARPWKGLVLSADSSRTIDRLEMKSFLNQQWRGGRRLALIGEGYGGEFTESYAALDFDPAPAWQKLRRISEALLLPAHDIIFLGSPEECECARRYCPEVQALPVFGGYSAFSRLADELWCLDPIPECWLLEPESMQPTVPRLPSRMLMDLAAHPEEIIPRMRPVNYVPMAAKPFRHTGID